jgi:DMSO reductase anchor subunit
MFQVAPSVVVFGYIVIAFVGAVLGTGSGMLLWAILKHRTHWGVTDALLGAIGAVLTVTACAIVPLPRNTVSRSVGPGLTVETALNRFQHPYIAAIIVALALPALRQLFVIKRVDQRVK